MEVDDGELDGGAFICRSGPRPAPSFQPKCLRVQGSLEEKTHSSQVLGNMKFYSRP